MNHRRARTVPFASRRQQAGGFFWGLVLGGLLGLGVALAVALYVSKVPVPFVDKLPQRTSDQDAAEAERNRNWDPNAPLAGKNPAANPNAKAGADAADKGADKAPEQANLPANIPAQTPAQAPDGRDPAAILSGQAPPAAAAAARSDITGLFVQAGAYARPEDAEQQKARLALLGFSARITEREQSGKTVYRVRVGPYETRDEAGSVADKLQAGGIEATLVRVERSSTP